MYVCNFPPHLIHVSALLCKTGNTGITPFHFNVVYCRAIKRKKHVIDYPSLTKRRTQQDQDRAKRIQTPDKYTVGVYTTYVCHDIECKVNYGSLFRLTWEVSGHYVNEIFYYDISNVNISYQM